MYLVKRNNLMSFIEKIHQILAGEVLDLNQRIKEKKVDDKQKKVDALHPRFDLAKMRVSVSHAYAGGYELTVDVPVPANFFKSKQTGGTDEFVRQLHGHIKEHIGRWLGTPYITKAQRARQGMINVEAMWHFYDAFFAYSLGLNLSQWRSSSDVVDKNQIHTRELLAEKAYKEFVTFRSIANKKLHLRSQDEKERSEIWKSEFLPDWQKLVDKWEEKGISFVELSQSQKDAHQQAVGCLVKIQKQYKNSVE